VRANPSRKKFISVERSLCKYIIMAVRTKAESLPIQITWRHLKGHQDNNAMFHQLDRWAQLNVQADGIAKNLLRKINQGAPLPNQIFTQSSLAL
jgi:hypothetical protein